MVFRGEGSDKTILVFQIGEYSTCFEITGRYSPDGIEESVSSNIPKHSTSIVVNGIGSNRWFHFYEKNHPKGQRAGYENSIGQINFMNNNNIMKYRAAKPYQISYGLKARMISPIENIGFEDLKLYRADTGNSNYGNNFTLKYAFNCWFNGVESHYTSRNHIEIKNSSNITVKGCYINDARSHDDTGRGAGVILTNSTSLCLIENNIFRRLRHSMLVQGGANSNVFIYNYSRERHWDETGEKGDISIHGIYPFANLFEQNQIEAIIADDRVSRVLGFDLSQIGIGDDPEYNGPDNALVRNKALDGSDFTSIVLMECPDVNIVGCELDRVSLAPIITIFKRKKERETRIEKYCSLLRGKIYLCSNRSMGCG